MDVLYFFESIRNPVLDAIMSLVTLFGSEIAFLAFGLGFYWCVSKNDGYYIISVGFVGTVICQMLKILCMVPRPWILDKNFTAIESAKADAGGYSFPSGHTQNSTGTYGSILLAKKHLWLRIVCIALMVLVPISRMYLGVHTPLDVGVSLLIGLALVFAMYPLFQQTKKNPNLMYWITGTFFLISIAFVLFAFLFPFPSDIDAENLFELRKNACTLIGTVGGVFVFNFIERKFVNFSEKATLPGQIVKLVVGLGLTVAIKEGLKAIFTLIVGEELLWMRSIRYFAVVAFAMAIYPLMFKFFANIGSKKASE